MFRIVEAHRQGKWNDDARCEDILHRSEAFVAVIDGASALAPAAGKSPGRIMADLVDEALGRLDARASAQEGVAAINAHVRDRLGYASSDEVLTRGPRPTAAALILCQARDEVWCVGDGWLMRDGAVEKLEIAFAEPYTYLRCAQVDALRRAGVPIETLLASTADAELIQPFIDLQPCIQNNPAAGRYAYGVIDGSDGCLPFVRVFNVSDAREIVLASDGYPILAPTLAGSEALLAQALSEDPLMIDLYPQAKPMRPGQVSFDDRTYVRLAR